MFSKTADEILQNVKNIPHKFFFAHRKPIPKCFEDPTEAALKDNDVTHFWFVEDDMILPPSILSDLLAVREPVVTVDYPVSKNGQGALFKGSDGSVIFSGTGCLLVERKVFDQIKKPYFRSDIGWSAVNYGKGLVKLMASDRGTSFKTYGLHDVNFGAKLHKAGIPITVLEQTVGQRKLLALGKTGSNNGAHQIEEWHKVKKDVLLKEILKYPVVPRGNLVAVKTPTGEINTNKKHAAKLIKEGLGVKVVPRGVIIDTLDVSI